MTRPKLRTFAGLFFAVLFAAPAAAQVKYPPRPESYDVHFRYRIRTDRDERIRQFRAMAAHLKAIGFVAAAKEDADLDLFDPTAELMNGTIPAAGAGKLFDDQNIKTMVLIPTGTAIPENGKQPLQVRIRIATGFDAKQQKQFHDQTVRQLGQLGFVQAVGYDTAGFAFVRGAMPAENLLKLLKDLRGQPSGWFTAAVPLDQLPSPFRATLPVRVVEVLPDLKLDALAPPPALPAGITPSDALSKLTDDVIAALADPMQMNKELRVDVILEETTSAWREMRFRLRTAADGIGIEGQVGPIITVRLSNAADVVRIAEIPNVRSIRLPRAAEDTGRPLDEEGNATKLVDALKQSKVAELHKLGYRGQGVRVVVIASEFPAATALIGRQLPKNTKFIDLTAELNLDLKPTDPNPNRPGTGTVVALLTQAAAPEAELTLVRVNPAAIHQVLTVARAVSGDQSYSEALQSRSAELVTASESLATRRRNVAEEYRRALQDLSDDEPIVARRKAAREAMDKLIVDEQAFKGVVQRFAALKVEMDGLKGAGVVVNTLTWDTGYPQDGLSELSRQIDETFATKPVASALKALKQPPTPIWVQSASTAVGQVWAGPFLDADDTGAMEFAPPDSKMPAGKWTRELNFLGFNPSDGGAGVAPLPAGYKLRLTVQWREPHDPDGFAPTDSVYLLKIRLLKQIDPQATAVASDEFQEIASSLAAPVRLLKTTGSGAFEQTLEVTIPADGIYAVRIDGRTKFAYDLPVLQPKLEIAPRIVVEPSDPASAAKGRPAFRTYLTEKAGVGIPGDAPAAVTIGVANNGSQTGAGPGVALRVKPDLFAPGRLTHHGSAGEGPAIAAAFAGGVGASLLSAGIRASDLTRTVGLNPGKPLVLSDALLANLKPRK